MKTRYTDSDGVVYNEVVGSTGDDYLIGTIGDDMIFLYEGSDTAYGKGGNDIFVDVDSPVTDPNNVTNLFGGMGNDLMQSDSHNGGYYRGGGGDDHFIFTDKVFADIRGGKGDDTLDLTIMNVGNYEVTEANGWTFVRDGDSEYTIRNVEHINILTHEGSGGGVGHGPGPTLW